MEPRDGEMLSQLYYCLEGLTEEDARWVESRAFNDDNLNDEAKLKLRRIFDKHYGYGVE